MVAEIAHWQSTLDVHEFHLEDVNPTVNERRVLALCDGLEALERPVTLKVASGTKLDTFSPDTLRRMRRAGSSGRVPTPGGFATMSRPHRYACEDPLCEPRRNFSVRAAASRPLAITSKPLPCS